MEIARAVTPILTVGSVEGVDEFYRDKLGFARLIGFAGEDGRLAMVTLVLGGAKLMFTRPREIKDGPQPAEGKRPVEIYFEVADIDAYHARLVAQGVDIDDPLTLQWWGDKTFKVRDPGGYEIWFYQKIGAPKPPQGLKIV